MGIGSVLNAVKLPSEITEFESRYLDWLVGPYPAEKAIYEARSPINHVDRLACPVIFFQGLEDKVVPPNQAEMMVGALDEKGLPVAYLAFEGEQHGFRRAETIQRTLEAELYFYGRIFGFQPADEIDQPVFGEVAEECGQQTAAGEEWHTLHIARMRLDAMGDSK